MEETLFHLHEMETMFQSNENPSSAARVFFMSTIFLMIPQLMLNTSAKWSAKSVTKPRKIIPKNTVGSS
jgi:hypothetical protein